MSENLPATHKKDLTYIQQAIFFLLKEQPFLGNFLQELTIMLSAQVPTAALQYDKTSGKFRILLNEEFFQQLTIKQRVAVLMHELMHFTNGHVFRWENLGSSKDMKIRNISADMAINQFINHLPDGCVNVADFKDINNVPFPVFKPTEVYFDLIKDVIQQQEDGKGEGLPDMWQKVLDQGEFDQHMWDNLSEAEKQQMLQEAKKLVQRTVEKTFRDYSLAPGGVKELLEEIETCIRRLDYKGLLRYAIKRSLSSSNRTASWYRPNKRYGNLAPGTTAERMPFLNIYPDSSGSISVREMNEFFRVVNGFLGAGQYKQCNIGFWHTELYLPEKVRKYKPNTEIKEGEVEGGGTEPLCVLEHIKATSPNLSLILTDGHYCASDIKLNQQVIWIISDGGNFNHPYAHIGITVQMSSLK